MTAHVKNTKSLSNRLPVIKISIETCFFCLIIKNK